MGLLWRMKCRCGSIQLRRSSRRSRMEYLVGALVLPWRCEVCSRRMFRLAWLHPSAAETKKPGDGTKPGGPVNLVERALDYTAKAFDRGTGDSDLN